MIRGAKVLTSPRGSGIVASITSRICMRASLACCSALASTSAGMPWTFMSSWIAVTNSSVPATLKSMSPSASSAPRMSVRVTYFPSSAIMPIAMPGNRRLERHTGVHHRQGRPADARHRRRAVGAHDVGHQTQGVGELVLVRHHRQQGALGERTVADLATPRRAHTTGLTGAVGREVVVVHVALRVLGIERVDHLGHAQHAQRGHVQHLRVAPAEQCRPVCPWQDADLGRQGPDLGGATAVEPHALLDHASTHDLLLQGLPCGTELGRAFGERILAQSSPPGAPWPLP